MGRFHLKLILAAGNSVIWAALGVTIVGYLMPAIANTWQVTSSQLGLIASLSMVGMMTGSVTAGALADRIGRRRTLEIAMVVIGAFAVASAFAWSYPVLLGFRFLTGLGLGAVLPVASTLVSEYSPSLQRGRLLVTLNAFWGLGSGVAALIGYWLVPGYGWRLPLLFLSLAALSAPAVHRYLPESLRFWISRGHPEKAAEIAGQIQLVEEPGGQAIHFPGNDNGYQKPAAGRETAPRATPWSKPYRRTTAILWVLWFALNFTFHGIFTWLPSLLVATGRSEAQSFLFMLVISLAQVPGTFIAAYLADAVRRRTAMMLFLLFWSAVTFIFGFASGSVGILSLGILMAVGNGAAWGLAYPFTTELYPTHMRGGATGWATGFGRAGGIVAPVAVGFLIQAGAGPVWIFSMLAAAPALCALVLFGLKQDATGRALEEISP